MTPLTLAVALFLCQSPGIHDGDTWTCQNGPKVRASGIDAPEIATPLGRPAARVMAGIIAGQTLTCEKRGTSWGRVVARCVTPDGQDVAEQLMRTGYALDCPAFSRGYYQQFRPSNAPILPPRHKSCEVKR